MTIDNKDFYKGRHITNQCTDIYFDFNNKNESIEVILAEMNSAVWMIIPRQPHQDSTYSDSPEFESMEDAEMYCKLRCES